MISLRWPRLLVIVALLAGGAGGAGCSLFGPPDFEEEVGPRLATLPGGSSFDRLLATGDGAVVYAGAGGLYRIALGDGSVQELVAADRLPRAPLLGNRISLEQAQVVAVGGEEHLFVLFDERTDADAEGVGTLYAVDPKQGGSLRPVLSGIAAFRVAPAGTRVAYVQGGPTPSPGDTLRVAPLDGARVDTAAARTVAQGRPVAFAPDGTALVYDASASSTALRRATLPADRAQTTTAPLPSAPASDATPLRLQARWTDVGGLRIAYRVPNDSVSAIALGVWREGMEEARTLWAPPRDEREGTNDAARWAPSGDRIAAWTRRCYGSLGFECTRSRYTLWRVDAATGAAQPVARTGEGVQEEAVFGPEGERLIYLVRRGEQTAIHVSALDAA